MKIKLIDLEFDKISYSVNNINNVQSKMVNIFYKENEVLQFQTPKMILKEIVKDNNKEYLLLQIIPTKSFKLFYDTFIKFEEYNNKNIKDLLKSNYNINSLIKDDTLLVKIPIKYSKPLTKIVKNNTLFNYYHLKPGMELICLLECNNIWINEYNIPSYHLIVKEILLI